MEKIINQDIANYLDKKVGTIDSWTSRNPKLLELCKIGAFCKKNDLDIDKIKSIIEFKEKMMK